MAPSEMDSTRLAQILAQLADEMPRQIRDVFLAFAQRRNVHGQHVQTVIQVFAKRALFERRAQIHVGGGDHAHIDVPDFVAAQPLELALLQDAQQLHLDAGRHVADFVHENGAGVGLFELAGLADIGARERALLVAEQFALHQIFGQRGAVDFDERPILAGRVMMNGARDHILADAAFAAQQNGGAGGRHALNGGEDFAHGRAAADDVVEFVALAQLRAQLAIFVAQRADLERFVHHGHQVIERKRLGKKIHRAGFHGFHRGFDAAERGHDDHGRAQNPGRAAAAASRARSARAGADR